MPPISDEELYRKCEELVRENAGKEFSARELADALNAGLTPEQQDQHVGPKQIRVLDVKPVGEPGEGLRKKKVSDKWIFLFQKGEVTPPNPSPKKDPEDTKPQDQPDEPNPPKEAEALFQEGGELDLRIQVLELLAPGNMCIDRTELITFPNAKAERYYYALAAHVWMVNKDWFAFQVQPTLFRMGVLKQQLVASQEVATKADERATKAELERGELMTQHAVDVQKAQQEMAQLRAKPATVPPASVPPVLPPVLHISPPSRTWNAKTAAVWGGLTILVALSIGLAIGQFGLGKGGDQKPAKAHLEKPKEEMNQSKVEEGPSVVAGPSIEEIRALRARSTKLVKKETE